MCVPTLIKVYMTDLFLFARLNLPNVLISVAKIFDSDFPSPCFDVSKASNFTSGGVRNHGTKNRRLGTIVTSIQDSKPRKKTDFLVIFLLGANQFAKKWYNSALFMRK